MLADRGVLATVTGCALRKCTPLLHHADPGLVGNLLVERLIGAHVWQVRLFVPFATSRGSSGRFPAWFLRSRRPCSVPCAPLTCSSPQVTKEEYGRYGSVALGERLAQQLRAEGHNPFVIPVGGSSSMGVWG